VKSVQIKIDDSLYDDIQTFACVHSISLEEAMTHLLSAGLNADVAGMRLTYERRKKELCGREARKARFLSHSVCR